MYHFEKLYKKKNFLVGKKHIHSICYNIRIIHAYKKLITSILVFKHTYILYYIMPMESNSNIFKIFVHSIEHIMYINWISVLLE